MNTVAPVETPTPSRKTLATTVAVTLVVAAVVLVTIVLPAEYGIDPTGVGRMLGLDQLRSTEDMGTVPMAAAETGAAVSSQTHFKSDTIPIEIGAHEQIEYKVSLGEGQSVLYSWQIDQGTIYSDFHGEPFNDLNDKEVRYEEGKGVSSGNGALRAPYSGRHGWYWRNDNDFPIKVTLEVSGFYTEHKELIRGPAQQIEATY